MWTCCGSVEYLMVGRKLEGCFVPSVFTLIDFD